MNRGNILPGDGGKFLSAKGDKVPVECFPVCLPRPLFYPGVPFKVDFEQPGKGHFLPLLLELVVRVLSVRQVNLDFPRLLPGLLNSQLRVCADGDTYRLAHMLLVELEGLAPVAGELHQESGLLGIVDVPALFSLLCDQLIKSLFGEIDLFSSHDSDPIR